MTDSRLRAAVGRIPAGDGETSHPPRLGRVASLAELFEAAAAGFFEVPFYADVDGGLGAEGEQASV